MTIPYYSPYLLHFAIPIALVGVYFSFEKYLRQPWMRCVWWIGCAALVALIGWRAGYMGELEDFFKAYYLAGQKIIHNPSGLYDQDCGGYVNIPILAYPFAPLGMLGKQQAALLFLILSYLVFLPLAYWLVRLADLKDWQRWTMLGLLAISGPLDYNFRLGNTTQYIMLGLVLALYLFEQNRGFITGVLLAISGLYKIPMIFPAGYFFFRRQWKVVWGGLFILILVIVLSLLFLPVMLEKTWLDSCILPFLGKPMAAYNLQSVTGVLTRALLSDSNIFNWYPVDAPPIFHIALLVAQGIFYLPALIVLVVAWNRPRVISEYFLEFSIILVCSLLASPISWSHYYVLLLIPAALYLGNRIPQWKNIWLNSLFAVSLILISIPQDLVLTLFNMTGQRLVLSVYFTGGCLMYGFFLAIWVRQRVWTKPTTSQPDL